MLSKLASVPQAGLTYAPKYAPEPGMRGFAEVEWRMLRRYERKLFPRCRLIYSVSDIDARSIRRLSARSSSRYRACRRGATVTTSEAASIGGTGG